MGIIYQFVCPGCSENYVGKTERNLITRLDEHLCEKESAINLHLNKCSLYKELLSHFQLFNIDIDIKAHNRNTILNNTVTLDSMSNWLHLAFLESHYIKILKPSLNTGTRAAKELKLF